MDLIIKVTQADITLGREQVVRAKSPEAYGKCCLLAHALNRAFAIDDASVQDNSWDSATMGVGFDLPLGAQRQIERFDSYEKVKPFSFTIKPSQAWFSNERQTVELPPLLDKSTG